MVEDWLALIGNMAVCSGERYVVSRLPAPNVGVPCLWVYRNSDTESASETPLTRSGGDDFRVGAGAHGDPKPLSSSPGALPAAGLFVRS